jgi:PIN domain nuclease of toxin-antitoxin system
MQMTSSTSIGLRSGIVIFLDTHAVIYIFNKTMNKFTNETQILLEEENLFVSPIILLELQYLYEIKRLIVKPEVLLNTLKSEINLDMDDISYISVIKSGLDLSWIRDPFDRLIVANAEFRKSKLVTKDERILNRYDRAVW